MPTRALRQREEERVEEGGRVVIPVAGGREDGHMQVALRRGGRREHGNVQQSRPGLLLPQADALRQKKAWCLLYNGNPLGKTRQQGRSAPSLCHTGLSLPRFCRYPGPSPVR